MADSSTMTIRVSADLKAQLDLLAHQTRRSRSFLAAEAVAAYVQRESAIVDGIRQGLADLESGNTVPHDLAMDELDAAIDEAAGS